MKRNFEGVWIPASVWLDRNLSITDKAFLVEIKSLDGADGCYAGNTYFANHFGKSNGRVSQIIANIRDKGYVDIEMEMEGNRCTRRVIRLTNKARGLFNASAVVETPQIEDGVDEGVFRKLNHPLKKTKAPPLENDQVNNTKSNSTKSITIVRFQEFWSHWPVGHKIGRGICEEYWKKNNLDDIAEQIIADVEIRKQRDDRWANGFVPNPITHLRQKRWEDDVIEKKKSGVDAVKQKLINKAQGL